jgi:peptidoglycan/LPS O-acetylase OafA/YrhL
VRQHTNAFDLIRLVAASMVLWSHQLGLMGLPEAAPIPLLPSTQLGGVGVLIFFAVSGYLNTLSAIRHRSPLAFLVSRALRIYPALIVCVGVTILIGACAVPDIRSYFDFQLLSFFCKNVMLLNGVKFGVSHPVFVGSTAPNALNGSIWTLPYEVKMYILLAICFVALRYNRAAVFFVSMSGVLVVGLLAPDNFWQNFSLLFVAGALVACIQQLKNLSAAILTVALLAGFFAVIRQDFAACVMALTGTAIALGSIPLPPWLRPPLDLSYAIYLYAFPVQQLSTTLTKNFWIGLTFSVTVTFLLALLSALFVEQPTLRLKPRAQRWVEQKWTEAVVKNAHLSRMFPSTARRALVRPPGFRAQDRRA